jgi:hypothetical protein
MEYKYRRNPKVGEAFGTWTIGKEIAANQSRHLVETDPHFKL